MMVTVDSWFLDCIFFEETNVVQATTDVYALLYLQLNGLIQDIHSLEITLTN